MRKLDWIENFWDAPPADLPKPAIIRPAQELIRPDGSPLKDGMFLVPVPMFKRPASGPTITNNLWSWGAGGGASMIGDSTTTARSSPVLLSNPSLQFKAVAVGNQCEFGLTTTGAIYRWGNAGVTGSLGDNEADSTQYSIPVLLPGSQSWSMIASASSTAAGLRTDGSIWTWGRSDSGQMGTGSTALKNASPVQIANTSSFRFISSHGFGAGFYAITIDGALWFWGLNSGGKAGELSSPGGNMSTPVMVSGGHSWVMAYMGGSNGAGIRTDGALFSWGSGTNGAMGDNTITGKSSPVQIGTSSWNFVARTTSGAMAIRIDGGLFTWGVNTSFVLGNSGANMSSPVQIGTSSWAFVNGGNLGVRAVDTVGRLFSWGAGAAGQLGDATAVTKSSPVQILTTRSFAVLHGSASHGNSNAAAIEYVP